VTCGGEAKGGRGISKLYDTIGATYTVTWRTEPRIAAQVWAALGDAQTALCVDATAESLPFWDQSFDAAMAFATIDHWQDPIAGLREYAGLWAGRPSLTELARAIGAQPRPLRPRRGRSWRSAACRRSGRRRLHHCGGCSRRERGA
jgi:hypothetical protein